MEKKTSKGTVFQIGDRAWIASGEKNWACRFAPGGKIGPVGTMYPKAIFHLTEAISL